MSTDTKTPSARKAASYTAGAPCGERLPGRLQPLLVGVVGQVHEHAARHVGPGQRADPVALVVERLARVVHVELARGRLVRHPPEQFVALQSRHGAGLGETVRSSG